MASRIYTVTSKTDPARKARLVRANRASQAVAHVAQCEWGAKVATQNDLERLLSAGVEDADQTAAPPAVPPALQGSEAAPSVQGELPTRTN